MPANGCDRCIASVQPVRRDKPLRVTAACQQSPKALVDGGGTPLETLALFVSLLGAGVSCFGGLVWSGFARSAILLSGPLNLHGGVRAHGHRNWHF
jgi:hypothetical protein